MPLLPTKSRDQKPATLVTPAWHPNFRNAERLPDTKTVRTAFFINIAAVTITLTLLIITVNRELGVHELAAEVTQSEVDIQKFEKSSLKAVALFQKFQVEEKKLHELDEFLGPGKFVLSDFVLHLGEHLPRKVALTHIEYRPTAVTLRGHARGTPDEAAGEADAYIRQLREDQTYGALFEDVSASNQGIDAATGWFAFDLVMKFKEAAPKDNKEAKDKEAKK